MDNTVDIDVAALPPARRRAVAAVLNSHGRRHVQPSVAMHETERVQDNLVDSGFPQLLRGQSEVSLDDLRIL